MTLYYKDARKVQVLQIAIRNSQITNHKKATEVAQIEIRNSQFAQGRAVNAYRSTL